MLVFPSRPPYRRHEPYQLLTPHAAAHHKRQCDVVSYARLLRLRQLKCTAGFSLGEQHGDCTRPSAPTVRSCLIELLIRSRPSSVGSVSQIGGQYPLCAFSAIVSISQLITVIQCNLLQRLAMQFVDVIKRIVHLISDLLPFLIQ